MAGVYNSQLDAFELYHQVQEDIDKLKGGSSPGARLLLRALGDGLSGCTGSAISNIAIYPLDLIITRLQIQRQFRRNTNEPGAEEYHGLADAVQKIYYKEGVKGFYAGVLSDTGKTLTDSFFFFLLYDYVRRGRLNRYGRGKRSLPAVEELGVGFVAGAATKLLTTPIANVVTRQQAAALRNSADRTPSAREIAQEINREEGWQGFWSGYSASLILTLNPSLTFFLFELLKRATLPRSARENPSAAVTFLLAALSKACASSVTYPFSLAKARLQAGRKRSRDHEAEEDRAVKRVVSSEINDPQTRKSASRAARSTIFSTLITIARTEGVSALYEGLHLEIVKAFFSHGITMLVKQAVQRALTQLYYTLRIILSRYHQAGMASSSPSRLAERAKEASVGYYDLSIKRVNEKAESAKEAARGKANEVAEFVHEYVGEEGGSGNGSETGQGMTWKDLYGTTGLARWLDDRTSFDK